MTSTHGLPRKEMCTQKRVSVNVGGHFLCPAQCIRRYKRPLRPNSKKMLDKLKNPQLFLGQSERWGSRGQKHRPPK